MFIYLFTKIRRISVNFSFNCCSFILKSATTHFSLVSCKRKISGVGFLNILNIRVILSSGLSFLQSFLDSILTPDYRMSYFSNWLGIYFVISVCLLLATMGNSSQNNNSQFQPKWQLQMPLTK